ncbi:MAG: hypothetical protein ACI9RP_002680 [Cyclobacteriaceae bacterium]
MTERKTHISAGLSFFSEAHEDKKISTNGSQKINVCLMIIGSKFLVFFCSLLDLLPRRQNRQTLYLLPR